MACVDKRLQSNTQDQTKKTSIVAKSTAEGRSPAEAVDSMKAAVLEEFQNSPIPVALIDHFSCYHACMRVMSKISEANHEEKLGYICKCPAETCLRTCDVYLKNCLMTSGIKPELVDCKVCNSCAEHILQEFGGVGLDAFLWDASLPV